MAQSDLKKAFSVDEIPDLTGKIAIVTGGATNIGLLVTLALLKRNATVYVASRSKSNFDAIDKYEHPELLHSAGSLKYLQLDLSSIKNCIASADHFLTLESRLDIVIGNAALSVLPEHLSSDGLEIQFATNHLGHFTFINRLLPLIKSTADKHGEARIVVVSSHSHLGYKPIPSTAFDFDNLKKEGKKTLSSMADVQASINRYARSKFANIMYVRQLDSQLRAVGCKNVFVNAANPGVIGSPTAAADCPWLIGLLINLFVWFKKLKPEAGTLGILLAATDPEIREKGLSGRYVDVGPFKGEYRYGYSWDATDSDRVLKEVKDEELGKKLWEWSEAVTEEALMRKSGGDTDHSRG